MQQDTPSAVIVLLIGNLNSIQYGGEVESSFISAWQEWLETVWPAGRRATLLQGCILHRMQAGRWNLPPVWGLLKVLL